MCFGLGKWEYKIPYGKLQDHQSTFDINIYKGVDTMCIYGKIGIRNETRWRLD